MTMHAAKSRFAPSPTGLLHLGNVRTALFNALLARKLHGTFLLRIEDSDVQRSTAEYAEALQEDLRWLGLDWQEGVGVDGPAGPYRQSERLEIYRSLVTELQARGSVYPCFCSPEALEQVRLAQRAAGQPPRYPGTCARLSADEVHTRRAQGLAHAWRLRVSPGQTVAFDDLVRGRHEVATDAIGDFVVQRADGGTAFLLSNAVDDALMGVTHVLRGEDHLSNTARQILILRALGLRIPGYGHLPMIVGADGEPLSKRNASASLRALRAAGYLPGAILNHVARLGHSYGSNRCLDLQELAAEFELPRLGRAAARHDELQLRRWQREAVACADAGTLWEWTGPETRACVPSGLSDDFVTLIRDNVLFPREALHWAQVLFDEPLTASPEAQGSVASAVEGFFRQVLSVWEPSVGYAELVRSLRQATGVHGRELFMPLRAALTGETHGPELERIVGLMPPERQLRRLQAAADRQAVPAVSRH